MSDLQVLTVAWPEIEDWLRTVSAGPRFDAIIGITRCGLPLAVALSFLAPHASLSVLARTVVRPPKAAFYDFSSDREQRIGILRQSFMLTPLAGKPKTVLIVDDVATFGDTFLVAMEKVREQAPSAEVRFACYAVDEGRIGSANPEILAQLSRRLVIDNASTWVTFPWNLSPTKDEHF